MNITPTHINYLFICHRKLWLFSHGMNMEHTSGLVDEGRQIHEKSYPQRAAKWQEVDLGIAKIDFYDPLLRQVHEIKKSNKKEPAHVAQVKYYIYLLRRAGVEVERGILEYPILRSTEIVEYDIQDEEEIVGWLEEIKKITQGACPGLLAKTRCRNCAYEDFCWSGETEENRK
ncbi:MAG: CRISPR-associated protein Cas4 [Chitinophagales bacterium]|nr:CRISPR-associated protein Cas4 [Chitinophagales bacterium]